MDVCFLFYSFVYLFASFQYEFPIKLGLHYLTCEIQVSLSVGPGYVAVSEGSIISVMGVCHCGLVGNTLV